MTSESSIVAAETATPSTSALSRSVKKFNSRVRKVTDLGSQINDVWAVDGSTLVGINTNYGEYVGGESPYLLIYSLYRRYKHCYHPHYSGTSLFFIIPKGCLYPLFCT